MSINSFFNCRKSENPRQYSKGKSFAFTKWSPSEHFVNDEFKQDFVSYNGDLYACMKSNINIPPGNSPFWFKVVEKIPSESFVPVIDDDGNLSWTERIGNEFPETINLRELCSFHELEWDEY